MNGTSSLRPASSVSWYLPKRSTTPARACGMIFTVFASSTTANNASSATITSTIMRGLRFGGRPSGLESGDGVDVRRSASDLEHLDRLPRFDGQRVVVRLGRPDLSGQLDPAGRDRGDLLGHEPLHTDQLA